MNKLLKITDIQSIVSQQFINQMPGFFCISDLKSRFILTNDYVVKYGGFSSQDMISGKSYYDMNCKASLQHEIFTKQDILTKEQDYPLKLLAYHCYANDEWRLLLGDKYPIKNEQGDIVAIGMQFNDITNYNLLDISKSLQFFGDKNLRIEKKPLNFILKDTYSDTLLSVRESECLFFLLRGKTTKEIAQILQLSPRTVESYIDHIKIKFACHTRSELLEKAEKEGYYSIIVNTLLNNSPTTI